MIVHQWKCLSSVDGYAVSDFLAHRSRWCTIKEIRLAHLEEIPQKEGWTVVFLGVKHTLDMFYVAHFNRDACDSFNPLCLCFWGRRNSTP